MASNKLGIEQNVTVNENKPHGVSSVSKGTQTVPMTKTMEKHFDTLFKENVDEEAEKFIERTFVRKSPRLVNKPVQHYALSPTLNPPKTFYDIQKMLERCQGLKHTKNNLLVCKHLEKCVL